MSAYILDVTGEDFNDAVLSNYDVLSDEVLVGG